MIDLPALEPLVCSPSAGAIVNDWIGVSMLAILASVMMLTILYLLANFFRSQASMAFIKLEFYEVLWTLVLLSVIGAVASSSCAITVGWFFPSSPNAPNTIYRASMDYFDIVEGKISAWMHAQYVLNLYMDQMASVTPYSRPLGIGLVSSSLAGFASPIKSFLYNVFVAQAIAYVINEAQKFVLAFAMYGFLHFYLPLGVFLRAFTPTRRLGGTLIALSICFVFVLPSLFTITSEMLLGKNPVTNESYGIIAGVDDMFWDSWRESDLTTAECKTLDSNDPAHCNEFECKTPDPADPTHCLEYVAKGPIARFFTEKFMPGMDLDDLIGGGFLTIIGRFVKGAIGQIFGFMLFLPLSVVGMAFMVGYLAPALNIVLFVYITKFFSRMLGEEVDVTALTRMI